MTERQIIMKAHIMAIKNFAVHDGPGIRTTLFLKGCPLRCLWCHNPEGMSGEKQLAYYAHKCISCGECVKVCPSGAHRIENSSHVLDRSRCLVCGKCEEHCLGDALKLFGREMTVDEAVRVLSKDKIFYEQSGGGVTFSGGEPLLQADFCLETAKRLKENGIGTAIDTCGCVPWQAFEKLLPVTDIFLFDIKHLDPEAHRRLTGQSNERILDNIRRLSDSGARIEVRMPLVPGLNDSETNIRSTGEFLSKLHIEKMRLLPYHSLARSKYAALGMTDTMPDAESPSDERLKELAAALQKLGVPAISGRE